MEALKIAGLYILVVVCILIAAVNAHIWLTAICVAVGLAAYIRLDKYDRANLLPDDRIERLFDEPDTTL